ncbi:type II toxin-antitoxin system RelE/ParE family toxin [Actinobacillus porcinus]|uniref:type II toxin-antitoxin system RelE/ParE family toxin n=1 Tax=Actinobacillus porcinus TaxID=51048 RepID=UPI002A91401D|nr:type II toxin-antitoxin system RelE/ParE family toxin [Actinobacillus porcinus]MDY6216369.1 type II toxin-antitoxin system RelE/ParE family toxin [Actinobacillus porcinus]
MNLTFIELPPFERFRTENLTDEEYRSFQNELLENPEKGEVIQGLKGLRKIRIADNKRNKGKRGGARVIYYYFQTKSQIFLIMAYGKNEQTDITPEQHKALVTIIERIKTKL